MHGVFRRGDEQDDGFYFCQIDRCSKRKVKNTSHGTKNLWDHLKFHHIDKWLQLKDKEQGKKQKEQQPAEPQQKSGGSSQTDLRSHLFTEKEASELVVNIIASANLADSIVENEYFVELYRRAFPSYKVILLRFIFRTYTQFLISGY